VSSFFALCTLTLVVAGNVLALGVLRHAGRWPWRRELQLFVLAAPAVGLSVSVAMHAGCLTAPCGASEPPWLVVVGDLLADAIVLVALAGIGLGLARLGLMAHAVRRQALPAGPGLQARADHLAARLGAPRPRVLLRHYDRPLALTWGLWRPTVLLSSWMVQHLDQRELEAVLAHELAHAARHDYLVVWLATVLRDAFCYLPTSWVAYRQLQQEKELACDDLAIGVTHRPLGLASALAKVWQQAIGGPLLHPAQPLVGAGEIVEGRITRLLATPRAAEATPGVRTRTLGASAAVLGGMMALGAVGMVALLALMGCIPGVLMGKLL
jgi:bla regulator protein BlaR1